MSTEDAVCPRIGLPGLNESIGTFKPGDLIVVASRPGLGRTALATFIAGNVAIEQSQAVAFFSLDLTAEKLTQRFVAARGQISISALATGNLKDQDYSKLSDVDAELRSAPIYIDESGGLSTVELRAKVGDLVTKYGVRLVIVDGLEFLNMAEADTPRDVARLLVELKTLARDLHLPFVVLTRLRWRTGVADDARPTVEELADPTVVQVADIVLLIHRQAVSDSAPLGRGPAEIIVARANRVPPPDVITAHFLGDCGAFERVTSLELR